MQVTTSREVEFVKWVFSPAAARIMPRWLIDPDSSEPVVSCLDHGAAVDVHFNEISTRKHWRLILHAPS